MTSTLLHDLARLYAIESLYAEYFDDAMYLLFTSIEIEASIK